MATPAPLPQRETTRRSRRLRGQRPLSPKSPPAEVVGSAATPPSATSPLIKLESYSKHNIFFYISFLLLLFLHLDNLFYLLFFLLFPSFMSLYGNTQRFCITTRNYSHTSNPHMVTFLLRKNHILHIYYVNISHSEP